MVTGRLVAAWQRYDTWVYAVFAMSCAIYAASSLHGQVLAHTGGIWIAPRDDLYLHFEHARALLSGRPFAWTGGAGYGSGDPSSFYVLLLAIGKVLGFQQLRLALWAAVVAGGAVVVALVAIGRVFGVNEGLPGRWSRFLVPPFLLSVGGLFGGLFVGEIGVLIAAWSLALLAGARLRTTGSGAGWLGAAAAVAVATRWESLLAMVVVTAWAAGRAPSRWARALGPPVAVAALLMLLNAAFTHDLAPSGLLADSPLFDPHARGWSTAVSALVDAVVALHHLLGAALPWWLAAGALAFVAPALRSLATVTAVQAFVWFATIALSAAPERLPIDLTPTVVWLGVLATQGLAVLGSRSESTPWLARSWHARAAVVVAALGAHAVIQLPRAQAEIWALSREARRLLDEDVTLGLAVAEMPIERILVASPGILTYVARRPALDLGGRGGFRGLPFSRASRLGAGATLELIERIPVAERPDAVLGGPSEVASPPFAELVTVLTTRRGSRPLLRCRWESFDRRGTPRTLDDGERVVAQLDLGDLVSEEAQGLSLEPPEGGWVSHALLADPSAPDRDLFDAGRRLDSGHRLSATFEMSGHRLILRLAPGRPAELALSFDDDAPFARLRAEPRAGVWQELSVPLPDGSRERRLSLEASDELVVYHLWIVGR
jgi:hypothetical protein